MYGTTVVVDDFNSHHRPHYCVPVDVKKKKALLDFSPQDSPTSSHELSHCFPLFCVASAIEIRSMRISIPLFSTKTAASVGNSCLWGRRRKEAELRLLRDRPFEYRKHWWSSCAYSNGRTDRL